MTLVGLTGCSSLPEQVERTRSSAFTDTQHTLLAQAFQDDLAEHHGQSGFLLLGSGLDAFVARAVLAELAERSLDVQYYLYHNDLTGKLFTYQLIKAADRGVRVRLLVDDMGLEGRDMGAAALDAHPNIEVRIINPFIRGKSRLTQYLTRLGEVTRRMHNKSFTADNQATILGGRNIGNEYFEADPDLEFGDLDVLAIGPVVQQASAVFDLYWNSELTYPVVSLVKAPPSAQEIAAGQASLDEFVEQQAESEYALALRESNLSQGILADEVEFHWGEGRIVYDHPDKLIEGRERTDLHMSEQLKSSFDKVKQELIIFSPYFVPTQAGVDKLIELSRAGVRVRILTNSLASTDVSVVHAGYAKYRKPLLRGGIELYEMNKRLTREQRKEMQGLEGSSKASLHAKSFVFDRQWVFIGSLNLDPRSVVENTEVGVVIDSPEIATGMADWFDEHIGQIAFRLELVSDESGRERLLWYGREAGKPVTFDTEPYSSFWRRLGVKLLGLLPIESQL
ncbi:MAG: phospholipase D family protein [Chromatiales bacterium]